MLLATELTLQNGTKSAVAWNSVQQVDGNNCRVTGTAFGQIVKVKRTLTVAHTTIRATVDISIAPGASYHNNTTIDTSVHISAVDDWFGYLHSMSEVTVWTSSLKRAASDHTPHWLFKSPVAMLAANSSAPCLALIPDLANATNASLHNAPLALDARNSESRQASIGVGLSHTFLWAHSTYRRDPSKLLLQSHTHADAPTTTGFGYYILLAPGVSEVTSHLWRTMGAPALAQAPSLQRNFDPTGLPWRGDIEPRTFAQWQSYAWGKFSDHFWVWFI